jgi:hypothetical protein
VCLGVPLVISFDARRTPWQRLEPSLTLVHACE